MSGTLKVKNKTKQKKTNKQMKVCLLQNLMYMSKQMDMAAFETQNFFFKALPSEWPRETWYTYLW